MNHAPTLLILALLAAAAALTALGSEHTAGREEREALLASVRSSSVGDLDARALKRILERGLLGPGANSEARPQMLATSRTARLGGLDADDLAGVGGPAAPRATTAR